MHNMAMAGAESFPWKLIVTAVVGVAAAAIATVSLLMLWSFTTPNDRVFMFSDHFVGGTSDKAVATSLAVVFGYVAVFALLTYRRLR